MHRARPARPDPAALVLLALLALLAMPSGASAQDVQGRVMEQASGAPVAFAGIFAMDEERRVLDSAMADSLGRYTLTLPGPGRYTLLVQRLGYFEAESPLVEVSGTGAYAVDFEMRPEPIRLEGIGVAVEPEAQNGWARDRLLFMQQEIDTSHFNPARHFGFHLITGARLEEAKIRSGDALDMLRWVYVPIYNGVDGMCARMRPESSRGGGLRALSDHSSMPLPTWRCGDVYLDGVPLPAEHVETLPLRNIHAVIVIPPQLHIVTVGFERRFQAARRR